MKTRINFALLLGFASLLVACGGEENIGQYPVSKTAPGKPTNVQVVENFGGGATIRYNVPTDADLLYVKALYTLEDGTPQEAISSLYSNTITIAGFAHSVEREVTLFAVDRSRNESERVKILIHPLESPIFDIFNSLQITEDFGGILVRWDNPTGADVVVMVTTPYENSELTRPVQSFYSKVKEGRGNVRGFPHKEVVFKVQVKDRWGNLTEVNSNTYVPWYEEEANKAKFAKWNGDPKCPYNDYGSSYPITKLWDNITMAYSTTANFYHTKETQNYFSFDMGQTMKISRIKTWGRDGSGYVFQHGTPKKFRVWGSSDEYARIDPSTAPNTKEHIWIELGEFVSEKPSGTPFPGYTNDDREYSIVQGEDFLFQSEYAQPVRYLRFYIDETWSGTTMVHISEMSIWGEPIK